MSKRGRPVIDPQTRRVEIAHVKVSPMVMAHLRAIAAYHDTTVSKITRGLYRRYIENHANIVIHK